MPRKYSYTYGHAGRPITRFKLSVILFELKKKQEAGMSRKLEGIKRRASLIE